MRRSCPCALLLPRKCEYYAAKVCLSAKIHLRKLQVSLYNLILRVILVPLVFVLRENSLRSRVWNCIFLPSLRTRRCVLIESFGVPGPIQSLRLEALRIPRLRDAIGLCTVEELVEKEQARFTIVGLDFGTVLPSSCDCDVFAIVLQLVKLKFRTRHCQLKWLILHR